MDSKKSTKRIAAIVTFITALCLFGYIEANDVGETSGGSLTGPFLMYGHLGSLMVAVASFAIFKFQRLAFYVSIIGMLMAFPWFSWDVSPAFWCSDDNCTPGGSLHSWFDLEPEIFWLLGLFILTLFLQRRAFAK